MAKSSGPDYGRSSPWYRYNTAPGRPGRRHMPPTSPAFRCYYVGISYILCLPSLYMRGLGYKCPTRTWLHILCKHNTTPSSTATYLVHYIRHNSNKFHLGEYSPPPWVRPCVKLPCTLDLSLSHEHRCYSKDYMWLHLQLVVPSFLDHSQHSSKIKYLITLHCAPNFRSIR